MKNGKISGIIIISGGGNNTSMRLIICYSATDMSQKPDLSVNNM